LKKPFQKLERELDFPTMWKLNESILGGDGEGREGFLDDESEGLCSLSPMQVYIYIYINSHNFDFKYMGFVNFSVF
jgi:hypothetical protein